jgi:hypothetical protein
MGERVLLLGILVGLLGLLLAWGMQRAAGAGFSAA